MIPGEIKEIEIDGILYNIRCHQCERCSKLYHCEEIFYVLTEVVLPKIYKTLLSCVSWNQIELYFKEHSDGKNLQR